MAVLQAVKMPKHKPTPFAQHGPDAKCGFRGCLTAIRWDVMRDEWVHKLTDDELDALADLRSGRLIALLRGE